MAIKAIIPTGQTEVTVNGLHQWDYGQELEIHDSTLPAIIEVHFACSGMDEAVVRSCAVVDGVAKAVIPDRCLEQTTPVIAWVYCLDQSCGYTDLTIIMPLIARTKPAPAPSVPTYVSDKYTELIAAINEQIGALSRGEVTAGKALQADKATEADHSTEADYATTASKASTATEAEEAAKAKQAELATNSVNSANAALLRPTQVYTYEKALGDDFTLDLSKLENNAIYMVEFIANEDPGYKSFHSGVYIHRTSAEYVTIWSCSLGDYYLRFADDGNYPGLGQIKKAQDDSVVTYSGTFNFYKVGTTEAVSTNTITFSVSGEKTYAAEEGMTWEQFVASEYNNGDFFISTLTSGAQYLSYEDKFAQLFQSDPADVETLADVIIANKNYKVVYG